MTDSPPKMPAEEALRKLRDGTLDYARVARKDLRKLCDSMDLQKLRDSARVAERLLTVAIERTHGELTALQSPLDTPLPLASTLYAELLEHFQPEQLDNLSEPWRAWFDKQKAAVHKLCTAQGRAELTFATFDELSAAPDPRTEHGDVARWVLETEPEKENDSHKAELARSALADEHIRRELAAELHRAIRAAWRAVRPEAPPTTEAEALEGRKTRAGHMLEIDTRLVEWLNAGGAWRDQGDAALADARDRARYVRQEAFRLYSRHAPDGEQTHVPEVDPTTGRIWSLWLDLDDEHGELPVRSPVICLLGRLTWRCKVRAQWEHEQKQRQAVENAGDLGARSPFLAPSGQIQWVGIPKAGAGMVWATETPGVVVPAIAIDGTRYTPEPASPQGDSICPHMIMPRHVAVLPGPDWIQTPQAELPNLNVDIDETVPDLAVALLDAANRRVLSLPAVKLALLMLAGATRGHPRIASTSIDPLTRLILPGRKRYLAREWQRTADALEEARSLFVYMPDGTRVQCFDVPRLPHSHEKVRPDSPVVLGTHWYLPKALEAFTTESGGHPFNGFFLLNLDAAMNMKDPLELRLYVRIASSWNAYWKPGAAGEPNPDAIPWRSIDELAMLTNTYTTSIARYMAAPRGRRNPKQQLRRMDRHKVRKKVTKALENLAERQLVVLGKSGTKLSTTRYRPLPTPEYLAAKKAATNNGMREVTLLPVVAAR